MTLRLVFEMRSAIVATFGLILLLLAAMPPAAWAAENAVAHAEMDHYNRGVALYRDQRYEESAEAFRKAAAAADRIVAARARFNLGNTDYARALVTLESKDPSGVPIAIEYLRSAIESYRSSLRLDSSDDDARFNLELASKLMRQLEQPQQEQQQQEQQQEEEKQEQKQEEGEEHEQSSEKPEEQSGESEGGEGENQDSQEGQQGDEDTQKSAEPQDQSGDAGSAPDEDRSKPDASDEPSDDTTSPEEGATEGSSDQNETENSPAPRDAAPGDERTDQSMSEQETAESNDPGETPEGELTAAGDSEANQPPADESYQPSGQPLGMTQEEARKLLQAIRDRDMLRRLRRQAAQRARQIPVERDW